MGMRCVVHTSPAGKKLLKHLLYKPSWDTVSGIWWANRAKTKNTVTPGPLKTMKRRVWRFNCSMMNSCFVQLLNSPAEIVISAFCLKVNLPDSPPSLSLTFQKLWFGFEATPPPKNLTYPLYQVGTFEDNSHLWPQVGPLALASFPGRGYIPKNHQWPCCVEHPFETARQGVKHCLIPYNMSMPFFGQAWPWPVERGGVEL